MSVPTTACIRSVKASWDRQTRLWQASRCSISPSRCCSSASSSCMCDGGRERSRLVSGAQQARVLRRVHALGRPSAATAACRRSHLSPAAASGSRAPAAAALPSAAPRSGRADARRGRPSWAATRTAVAPAAATGDGTRSARRSHRQGLRDRDLTCGGGNSGCCTCGSETSSAWEVEGSSVQAASSSPGCSGPLGGPPPLGRESAIVPADDRESEAQQKEAARS